MQETEKQTHRRAWLRATTGWPVFIEHLLCARPWALQFYMQGRPAPGTLCLPWADVLLFHSCPSQTQPWTNSTTAFSTSVLSIEQLLEKPLIREDWHPCQGTSAKLNCHPCHPSFLSPSCGLPLYPSPVGLLPISALLNVCFQPQPCHYLQVPLASSVLGERPERTHSLVEGWSLYLPPDPTSFYHCRSS